MNYIQRSLALIPALTISILAVSDSSTTPVIFELASPAYEGRGVGTEGLNKARDYIIEQFRLRGLAPAFHPEGQPASYTQELRVFIGNEVTGPVSFLGSNGNDFVPLAFSKSGILESAEIVFVGFGITVRQNGETPYDDYAGVDVKNKIVVALMGDPGTGNRDSIFRDPAFYHYSSAIYKVQNAEIHGAAGIVLVRDPLSLAGATEPPLRFQDRQGGGASAQILAGQASIKFIESQLKINLTNIQSQIAKSQQPASFAVDRTGSLQLSLQRRLGSVQNIVAILPGTDPQLAHEFIILGAHYDHLGYGGDSSMDPDGVGKIHPGADDNASGVQAVLDLAGKWKSEGGNKRTLLFALFTAEEVGLLGSKHFTEDLPLAEGAKAVAMLNFDMVGRMQENKLSVLALRSGKEFPAIVDSVNEEFKLQLSRGDSGFGSSDHASFLEVKIPALFFTTGSHPDYHRPSDTADKINGPGLLTVENFATAILERIDGQVAAPTWDPASEDTLQPPREGRGYGVYFGSIPDFDQSGEAGVRLSGVRAGSPAEQAGLKAGDLLVGLGEIKIRSLYDLVFALRFYRPNEEVSVIWQRAGELIQGKTILKNREEH